MRVAREAWRAAQSSLDPARLVFLDETATATNMTRPRGRAPKGNPLIVRTPHGHRKTTTFVAGLRCDGLTAPLVLDGAMNGDAFLAYVRDFLAPTLRPGDVVVMDNLSSHKVAGVRAAIEGADASLLYLPSYSPDLNPIEMAFAKLKRLLRKAAERTVDGLWNRIGETLREFTGRECRNYLSHQGYRST